LPSDYRDIVQHYEQCLAEHGDSHLGVDWPKKEDADTRYRVMLDVAKFDPAPPDTDAPSLLDFGCGAAHLRRYMLEHGFPHWSYAGLDLSEKFVSLCRQKFPEAHFYCGDVLQEAIAIQPVDYLIMNGVFTEKRSLSFDEMLSYTQQLLTKVFPLARRGIAFNVMSKQVDWERDDLFHLPIDTLAKFVTKTLSRHFIVRNDYGLYEYTVYLYH
jgi:SAM-dependent methyltransferase